MIYKYELVCKEAGLSEEQIAEIRKFFDAEKKRLAYDKKTRQDNGISFSYIQNVDQNYDGDSDMEELDFVDENFDLEELIIHKLQLEKLSQALSELPETDREFLLAYYSEEYGSESSLARRLGIPRTTLIYRKEKLLKRLREIFEKN